MTTETWNRRYATEGHPWGMSMSTTANLLLQSITPEVRRDKHLVVDLGCGDGRDSFSLAQNGLKVVGIDNAKTGIQSATGHKMWVKRIQGQRDNLPSFRKGTLDQAFSHQPNTVDAMTSHRMLHLLTPDEMKGLSDSIANSLREGGGALLERSLSKRF